MTININNFTFPFKTTLSLHKLVEFWKAYNGDSTEEIIGSFHSKRLINEINKVPDLLAPIEDFSILQKNKTLIDAMMTVVFPASQWETSMMAATPPFSFRPFYMTPEFNKYFIKDGDVTVSRMNIDKFEMNRAIGAYTSILKYFYNIDLKFIYPIIVTIEDEVTGLDRYFKMNSDRKFMDIKVNGELPKITEEQIRLISENMMNLEIWTEILPPEIFEFNGFISISMIEVTEQEAISNIKFDLLDKNVLATTEGFEILQNNFRTLFRNPKLILGLTAITKDKTFKLNKAKKIIQSFLVNDKCVERCDSYEGSIYETAISSAEPVIIYDLDDYKQCTEIENVIREDGIKNIFIVALKSNHQVIGLLEIGSPNPGDINSVNAIKLNEVLPLFTIALKNAMEDMENRIQAVIKEKCTAIHPSVEWRFRDAAIGLIEKQQDDKSAEMEEIVFKDVYPLYGLADIRDSSKIRNEAIQQDLCDNLEFAREIINGANQAKQMPIYDHLIYRITKRIGALNKGLSTGDEASVVRFLHNEVEPMFKQVYNLNKGIKTKIENYYRNMSMKLGIYYNKRKAYDESVSIINETISNFVKKEEDIAQLMFPHYFEKYKTDGVEYTIYLGDAISQHLKFDMMYLKNMRLWQLLLMCGIAARSAMLKPSLPVQLETANLILAQDRPLTIRFHLDQKKFDVDGTYNVHYEIMKKRIDKAEIRGSEERLTQPGKIAIVYTQNSEAAEYRQYIDYLHYKGFLKGNVEEYDLEDLQGVYGLKALRVNVALDKGLETTKSEIDKAIHEVKEIFK